MAWTRSEAMALLRCAFPWGAHVTVKGGSEFLAVRFEVLRDGFGDDHVVIRFDRDPGDTLQGITRRDLEVPAMEKPSSCLCRDHCAT